MSLGRGLQSLIPPHYPPSDEGAGQVKKNDDRQTQPRPPVFLPEEKELPEITGPEPQNLLPESDSGGAASQAGAKKKPPEAVFQIEIEKIKPNPLQPRKDFDKESLKELAASIREYGIIQPLIISKIERETPTGTDVEYQLIAGERRLKAARMLGWERVPAIVRKVDVHSERLGIAIVENLQREDLNPVETARAYAKLQDEFRLTQREIANRLGKSRETVANALRLLNLPSGIQDALAKNQINESQARLLLAVPDIKEQEKLFKEIIADGLSVRELKNRVRKNRDLGTEENISASHPNPEISLMEEELSEALGAKVDINPPAGTNKTGKIVITFYSPEEIRGIIEKINPRTQKE